jgi:hypothetical protein
MVMKGARGRALPAAALLALALALASAAQAQRIYVCRDGAGHALTSDRPIVECASQPVREIDRSGITRREVPPPLSPEQKERQRDEVRRRRAEQQAAEDQRRADRALLTRFHSESDIDAARRSNTERVRENARREAQLLGQAQQRQRTLELQLSQTTDASQGRMQQLEEADRTVAQSRRRLDDYEAEIMQINTRMDATLMRFRELQK